MKFEVEKNVAHLKWSCLSVWENPQSRIVEKRWEKYCIFPVTLAILEYVQFLDRPNLSFEMEGMWVKLYELCGGARVPTAKMEAVWLISGCAKNRANFGWWKNVGSFILQTIRRGWQNPQVPWSNGAFRTSEASSWIFSHRCVHAVPCQSRFLWLLTKIYV